LGGTEGEKKYDTSSPVLPWNNMNPEDGKRKSPDEDTDGGLERRENKYRKGKF